MSFQSRNSRRAIRRTLLAVLAVSGGTGSGLPSGPTKPLCGTRTTETSLGLRSNIWPAKGEMS